MLGTYTHLLEEGRDTPAQAQAVVLGHLGSGPSI